MAKPPNKHTTRQKDYTRLRQSFDASDPGGFEIRGEGHSGHNERLANTPEWATDDAKVREILLRAFPHMHTNPLQRKRAGFWMRIINAYFRCGNTALKVALEVNHDSEFAVGIREEIEALLRRAARCRSGSDAHKRILKRIRRLRLQHQHFEIHSLKRVTDTIARISLVANNLRTDGKPRIGKFGRPKKSVTGLDAYNEGGERSCPPLQSQFPTDN